MERKILFKGNLLIDIRLARWDIENCTLHPVPIQLVLERYSEKD